MIPKLGILAWERGKIPRGLMQLEELKGNSTNPDTYNFPVMIERIPGACRKTILEYPDQNIMQRMIDTARRMETLGVKAITTSCGFNAIFQTEIARSLRIPFFSSSLLQIPFLRAIFGSGRPLIILTASKSALKPEHFLETGTSILDNLPIYGMRECCDEWAKMSDLEATIDIDVLKEQFVEIAQRAARENPNSAAFVFECTDMPPFSNVVKKTTGLPVFDFVTMAEYIYRGIIEDY